MPANETEKEQTRLQVYLAHCGVASRRASEKIILDGRVTVNGQVVVELGTKVTSSDKVCVDGKEISLEENKRYVLLNKPSGYICSSNDEQGRQRAIDLLTDSYSERLYNVGRLDMFSSGLIIFTNDGDFAARLSHPSSELEKEYVVDSSLPLPRGLCDEFMKGLRVDGTFYKCKAAKELNSHRMQIVLVEGKNREIRRVFESKGVAIKRLVRVRIGNIEMNKLAPGDHRDLTPAEVKGLLAICKQRED